MFFFSPSTKGKKSQREEGTEKELLRLLLQQSANVPPPHSSFIASRVSNQLFPPFAPLLLLLLFVRIGGGPTLTFLPPDFLEIKKERRATKTKEKEGVERGVVENPSSDSCFSATAEGEKREEETTTSHRREFAKVEEDDSREKASYTNCAEDGIHFD